MQKISVSPVLLDTYLSLEGDSCMLKFRNFLLYFPFLKKIDLKIVFLFALILKNSLQSEFLVYCPVVFE